MQRVSSPIPRRRSPVVRLGVALLALVATDQVVQHTILRDGWLHGHRLAPYDPPLFSVRHGEYVERLERWIRDADPAGHFDAELGWCPRPGTGVDEMSYDWAAARLGFEPLERRKRAGVHRVVAVGCSYTRGDEVHGEEAWASLLGRELPDWEVANLGVGGYGLDQALLRLERDGAALEPDEVWLGYLPRATGRLVTTYMPALNHWYPAAFKPRFRLDASDALVLVPAPARSLEELHRLLTDQASFLRATPHDRWVAHFDAAYAPRGSRWTHALAATRLLLTYREGSFDRDLAPEVADPTGEAHRLLRAVVLRARDEADRLGARFRLLVLPGQSDLRHVRTEGRAPWATLADDLRGEGVEVVDLSLDLLEAGALERPDFWTPGRHYTARANRVVADVLKGRLAGDR